LIVLNCVGYVCSFSGQPWRTFPANVQEKYCTYWPTILFLNTQKLPSGIIIVIDAPQ